MPEELVLHLETEEVMTLRMALVAFMAGCREIDTGRDDWPVEQSRIANGIYEAVLGGGK